MKKTTLPNKRRYPGYAVLAIAMLGFLVGPVVSQGYAEPAGSPPDGIPSDRNQDEFEFLNGSGALQQKMGSLTLGDVNNVGTLCLNSDSALGIYDTENCIRNWNEVTINSDDTYLRKLSDLEANLVDSGYIQLRSNSDNNQLISLILEAPPNRSSGTALYAGSLTTSSYAAQFSGNVGIFIDPDDFDVDKSLSLNQAPAINKWSDIAALYSIPFDSVLLQTESGSYVAQNAPGDLYRGNVGLSGPLVVSSLVLGRPTADTSLDYTCGDGICSYYDNGESYDNCPVDCD